MKITVEQVAEISVAAFADMQRAVLLALGQLVQHELMNLKPAPPAEGSMKFKTDKQRKYVMAMISQKRITVPYIRGSKGGKTLNRSFRVDLEGDVAKLYSSAMYAPYVVGDQQAQIHQGRWTTAEQAYNTIESRGDIERVVESALSKLKI